MLAESPRDPFLEVLQSKSLPPSAASSATGRSDRNRVGITPTENQCLSTAHAKDQVVGDGIFGRVAYSTTHEVRAVLFMAKVGGPIYRTALQTL